MANKVPSFVSENEQRRLTLAGRFAMSAGALPDEYVAWLLKNENHDEIPELLAVAALLSHDQRLALKESAQTDSSRITIPSELASEWESFWKIEYEITTDFAGLLIPREPLGYRVRFIAMPEKASQAPEMLYQSDAKAYDGKVWKFTDRSLEELGMTHKLTGTFGSWVADVEEAPDGLVGGNINLSTAAVDDIGWATETLPMRQAHGRKYWREHAGVHLDQQVITFCAGSRLPGGRVPAVDFLCGRDEVYVYALNPRIADVRVRFRRAVV